MPAAQRSYEPAVYVREQALWHRKVREDRGLTLCLCGRKIMAWESQRKVWTGLECPRCRRLEREDEAG